MTMSPKTATTLKNWSKRRDDIMNVDNRRGYRKTLKVYPRRALLPEMENELMERFIERERWGIIRDDLWLDQDVLLTE